MPFETHGGLTFHVQELGSGRPVVMLHGLLVGSMATWYFSTAQALASTHRVLLYDLRGHGKSERARTGYDIATMVDDLRSICARFDTPLTLVGHSYGAVVSLKYALAFPELVEKLVLVEAPLPPSQAAEFDAFLSKPVAEMVSALPSALQAAVARGGRGASRFAEGLRFLALESSLFSDLRAAEDIADDVLSALNVPSLCIYGSESSCKRSGERLSRALPKAKLTVLAGGHFLPVEAPKPLTSSIVEFIHG